MLSKHVFAPIQSPPHPSATSCTSNLTPLRTRRDRSSRRPTYVETGATTTAVNQPFNTLAAWLRENGGSVDGITAGDCRMGDVTVRGLVAQRNLEAGTPVISVPISSTLRDDRAAAAYPGAPWNANLAAQLLQERSQGPKSRFYPYLNTLPQSYSCPLLLPQQSLQAQVQYEPAVAAIASYQDSARNMYESWCEVRSRSGLQQYIWDDWCWALHMVQSRSIRLAITGCKVMIPGIDLLNHGGSAANGQLVLGRASWQVEGEPAVVFVTTQHITAGQQVLWSYGNRGNDDFFIYHGFALPDNPDEDFVLFDDVEQLVDWGLQHVVQQQQQWQQQLLLLQGPELRAQLYSAAAAAATRAAQEASARCSAGAIQGTSSSILLPLRQMTQKLQQQQQQQQQQQWDGGSSGACEAAVLSAVRRLDLRRRVASFRLHRPEWGESSCPPTTSELVVRHDGYLDVRIPAVLAAVLDTLAAAAAAEQSGSSDSSSHSSSSSDTFSQQQRQQQQLPELLSHLMKSRCQELLSSFQTTLAEDEVWLQQHGSSSESLAAAAVTYRRGKKAVLHAQLQ